MSNPSTPDDLRTWTERAISIGTFVYVVVLTVVEYVTGYLDPNSSPTGGSTPAWRYFVAVGVGFVSLRALVSAMEWVGVRIAARRFLGTWYYYSTSGNFAVAWLSPGAGKIEYRVLIFERLDELEAYADGRSRHATTPTAWAKSSSTVLRDGELEVTYEVDRSGSRYEKRKGLLTVAPDPAPGKVGSLHGSWQSTRVPVSALAEGSARGRTAQTYEGELFLRRDVARLRECLQARLERMERDVAPGMQQMEALLREKQECEFLRMNLAEGGAAPPVP